MQAWLISAMLCFKLIMQLYMALLVTFAELHAIDRKGKSSHREH